MKIDMIGHSDESNSIGGIWFDWIYEYEIKLANHIFLNKTVELLKMNEKPFKCQSIIFVWALSTKNIILFLTSQSLMKKINISRSNWLTEQSMSKGFFINH